MNRKMLNRILFLALFIALLLPTIATAQDDAGDDNPIVTLNLTKGEIVSYELLYAGIIRLVRESLSSYSSSNQVLGRVTFNEPGEYLLSTGYLEIESETQGKPTSPSFSPLIVGEPTGICRNRAFAEHDNVSIFINCPGTISFVYGASTQFATLLIWQVSDQSPFVSQENETETINGLNSETTPIIELDLATGEEMDYELLIAAPIQTESDRISTYSTGNRQINGSLKFTETGEYVFLTSFLAIVKNEEPTNFYSSISVRVAAGSCRNRAFDEMGTATLLMNCPGSILFTVRTAAQFNSLLLWRIHEEP